jgi:hypothetical protein
VARLIDYDVTGVEESGGGTGVKVPTGLRVGRIALCEQREVKANGQPANDIRVGLDMGPDYDWLFTYIGLGPESDWKLAEFIRACQLKEKGKLDPTKQVGKIIRVKVNHGEYNGEYAPDAGKLMPSQDGDEVGGLSATAAANGSSNAIETDEEEATSQYADGFVPSREDDPEVGSYDDWADDDLEAEVNDRGATIPGGRGNKRDKLIKALREEDNAVADAADEAEQEAENGDEDGDDYESWDIDALKKEWEDRNLGDMPKMRGSGAAERLTAAIIEALREDDAANPFE